MDEIDRDLAGAGSFMRSHGVTIDVHGMLIRLSPKEAPVNENTMPRTARQKAVFDTPTEATCYRNYAEGARCGRAKKHEGPCSQVSRWVTAAHSQD